MKNILRLVSVIFVFVIICDSQKAQAQVTVDLTTAPPSGAGGCCGAGGCYCYDPGESYVATYNNQTAATFIGGKIINCSGGAFPGFGYGSKRRRYDLDPNQLCYPGHTNPMQIVFPRPVYNIYIELSGDAPQTITITDSLGQSTVVNLVPSSPSNNTGYAYANLPGINITSLSLQSSGSTPDNGYAWNMRVPRLSFYWSNPSTPPQLAPGSCNLNTINRPLSQSIVNMHGWSMLAQVTDNDGLVLNDVRLGSRYLAKSISLPYFNLETSAFPKQRGELKPDSDDQVMCSRLVSYYTQADDMKFSIVAMYTVDRVPLSSQSCLHVFQRYEFYKRKDGDTCEPSAQLPCQRFKPVVQYLFYGANGETLTSFNVAQRRHFQIDGRAENSIGFFKDADDFPSALINLGFIRKENPLFYEQRDWVIKGGKDAGTWDNIHQTYNRSVEEPFPKIPNGSNPSLFTSGCTECLHSHWRWATFLNGEGSGKIIGITPWSRQDMELGVTLYKSGEEHPSDFRTIVDRNELIRKFLPFSRYVKDYPEETVEWFSATGYDKSDYFFASGGFFNPPLQTNSLHSTTVQDGLSSVVATNVFQTGNTTVTTVDPTLASPLPTGYTLYNNLSNNIDTLALAGGPYTTTFKVSSVTDQNVFNNLRVLHAEYDSFDPDRIVWVDRTVLAPDPQAPDFTNKTINAKASGLGAFVVASFNPPTLGTTDISVSGSDSADPIVAGSNLTYTFPITNNGSQQANNTAFVAQLPANLFFVSATSTQGTCKETEGKVSCNIGSLAAGSTATVTLIGKPSESPDRYPPQGRIIVNTAFVRADEEDNNLNNNVITVDTTILPDTNTPPTVSIVSPNAGALFTGPATISLIASASDANGSISIVDFYDGDELLGSGTSSGTGLYAFTKSNVPVGNHTFYAIATDNLGTSVKSSDALVVVNGLATINITSPISQAQFNRPANITVTADASYSGGSISKVEFYADSLLLGTGTLTGSNQYSFTWNDARDGNHVITAVATDNNDVVTVSRSVTITVNDSPGVSLSSPTSGASYTFPATVNLMATASDGDGYVNKVDFYANGSLIGSNSTTNAIQHSYNWAYPTPGTYSVTAVAMDNSGATTTSSPINMTINPAPASGTALLVVGSTTLNAIDTDIKNRLQTLGLTVTVKSASSATSADATGKRVVVISESVSPTNVNTKFRTVAAPVVTLEPQLFDDMGMTGTTSGTDFGSTGSQTKINISNSSSPLAASLSGTVTVVNASSTLAWGVPNGNATIAATIFNNVNRATIFGYENGVAMPD